MAAPALSAVDINRVGRSWIQNQASMYDAIPKARTLGEFSGRKATTYDIPHLKNLLMTDGLYDFGLNASQAKSRRLEGVTITMNAKGKETFILERGLNRPFPHAFADLENNITPGLLGAFRQGAESIIVDHIVSTFSSTVDFTTSSGKSLDDVEDVGSQNPLNDLMAQFDLLRKFEAPGFALELWLDQKVASVLARHPAITGHGALVAYGTPSNTAGHGFGSGTPAAVSPQVLAERLKTLLGIAEVRVWGMAHATVREGQTVGSGQIQEIGHGLVLGGIFDRRKDTFDVMPQTTDPDAPDGCLVIPEEKAPYVHNWVDGQLEKEMFVGRGSFDVVTPRSEFGFRMTPTGDGGALSS